MTRNRLLGDVAGMAATGLLLLVTSLAPAAEIRPLIVIVMDPMSDKLSCDCVKGYAQRKYETLGEHLESTLGRPVKLHWSDSLTKAMKEDSDGKADLIIGKHSVVLADAKAGSVEVVPIASLTDNNGKTTQRGLLIVRSQDPAKSVSDLKGYRILFGPADCDEKYAAPIALLKEHGIAVPDKPEILATCSVAATKLMELPEGENAAAVISSYAEPLLAGCGAVRKGDLRIVGETSEVPFITAFANLSMSAAERAKVLEALLEAGKDARLLLALETERGFVKFVPEPSMAASKKKN